MAKLHNHDAVLVLTIIEYECRNTKIVGIQGKAIRILDELQNCDRFSLTFVNVLVLFKLNFDIDELVLR